MTTAVLPVQDVAHEAAVFDGLAARGTHGGLSAREYSQFFRMVGLVHLPGDTRIVDFGCGDGLMACQLAELGFKNVVGVDISPGNIAVARRRAKQRKVAVDFHVGDISDLPWIGSHSCDVVLSSGVVHHFPTFETKRSAVAEAKRVLRPGGLFAGIEPNRWNPYWYLPMLMMKLTWSRLPISFHYVRCHCTENEQNQLSPRELGRVFRTLGILHVSYQAFPYIKPQPGEYRYHKGVAAAYRGVVERLSSFLLPGSYGASYFVFKAEVPALN